jgi:hypothetical protein
MAITSQVRSPATFGEVIVQHWQAAQLLKLSAIKPVFTTLDKRLVRKSEQQVLDRAMKSCANRYDYREKVPALLTGKSREPPRARRLPASRIFVQPA